MAGATTDPFVARFDVPITGGRLEVARAGAPASGAKAVVVALHGITASHMAWTTVARLLVADSAVCLLAPDLRGRGRSASVRGPYGIAAHVADVVALLDHERAPRVVLAGHSMGAYVAARLAADHPSRVSNLVLVDGGLPIPLPADADPDQVLKDTLGPAVDRLGRTFATRGDYVAMWREHPAFAASWDADVEAYVNYDVRAAPDLEHPDGVRSVVSPDAVFKDGGELLRDRTARTAADRVRAPVSLLRAPRGMLDDDRPLIPRGALEQFASSRPHAHVENVPDVNHYTILLGRGPGPHRTASALRAAIT